MTDYDLRYPIQRKIKSRMDQLQQMMETNQHLIDPNKVSDLIESVSKFWPILQEEDRDYIHGCQYAVEEQIDWKVDE